MKRVTSLLSFRVYPLHVRRLVIPGVLASIFVMVVTAYLSGWFEVVPDLSDARFTDTSLSVEDRIDDLLAHMTLEEKIGQMTLVEKNSLVSQSDITQYGIGAVLSGAGAKPVSNTVAGWSSMIAEYQASARASRLGIPLLYGADAVHGHALVPEATVFPHQIALGATGDALLVKQIAAATAEDMRATGVNWNYAPNLDLPQDIRWGRMYEAFSDDHILTSRLGAAYVLGLQATTTANNYIPVLATLKHFVGLGAMQWNTSSNKNFKIDQGVTAADEEALQTAYLEPFGAGIAAGAQSVMVGLNGWGETKIAVNTHLVTDVLKGELGFTGFAVSDWYGVYDAGSNNFWSTVTAINAGIDMVMLPYEYEMFSRHMQLANRLGLISTNRIDDAVRRILRAKFALGLFDEPVAKEAITSDTSVFSDHRSLARAAVAQSLVLLKNENQTLPISPNVRHIRVAGSAADNVGMQAGAWTVEWQGIDGNWLAQSTSILAALRARIPVGTQLEYSASGTFTTSREADLGIAVVGEQPYAEGWGDRANPVLSDSDLAAIKQLQVSCKKVVVIIVSGRPLLIEHEVNSWDALVAAWLPGSEGAGVVDVLFGDKPFRGTLPLPWPRTSEQLPLTLQGVAADGTAVLFPRYFGLSY